MSDGIELRVKSWANTCQKCLAKAFHGTEMHPTRQLVRLGFAHVMQPDEKRTLCGIAVQEAPR